MLSSLQHSPEIIPEELRALRRWVCWRGETRKGESTKVPYDVRTGTCARVNDPKTWATFAEAMTAVLSYQGVGFMLLGSPFIGFDFDGCVSEAGMPEPYVLEIIRLLGDPYVELTPSGRGLRAFVVSRLPPGKRKVGRTKPEKYGAEVYAGAERGRYLTVTGRKVQGDGIPQLESIWLPYFLLTQILDERFKKLWMGSTEDYGGDDSRADLALMGILVRTLGRDPCKMEETFSASRLGQRDKWTEREDYRRRTIERALGGNMANPAPQQVKLPNVSLSDTGNAELAAQSLGAHALYCKEQKKWYLADQTRRWSADRTNRIQKLVQDVMLGQWTEITRNPNPKDPRLRHALHSLEHHAIRDCVSILQFQQDLAVLPEQLDQDPLLLGVENGILHLGTGELVAPRLDLLVTKSAPVRFDPEAKCDRWLEYLERVQPKEENRQFLQRLAGALLTGLQPEQSFIFFLGEGGNGKSVFIRVWHDLLGTDYAFKARKQLLFLPDRRTGEYAARPNDIADLMGARMVTSTEQVGKRWNLEFIKDYTGGEPQHARQIYHVGLNFKATGKILVSANEEPMLDEFDEAVRRRFVCLPWDVVIPEKERIAPLDLYVSSLLRGDGASGILNWAIEGLRDLISRQWRLEPPQAALERTREYLHDEDRVARFFRDWFEDGPVAEPLTTKQIRKYFVAWLDEPDKFVMSAIAFTKQCRRLFGKRCHKGRSRWHVVDDLRLSERGHNEYDAHDKTAGAGEL